MNCKPGDLAICIRSRVPQNVGRIFKVIEWSAPANMWWVEPANGFAPIEAGTLAESGFCHDYRLRPISGLPDTEDTDEREPIKEVA